MPTIEEINRFSDSRFKEALEHVFKDSPWIAEGIASTRPFENGDKLHAAMCNFVVESSQILQLDLIQAHPDFVEKFLKADKPKEDFDSEEEPGVLDELTDDERNELTKLNTRYSECFRMPFIICVKLNTKEKVLEALRKRLNNDREAEIINALEEIFNIAKQKLEETIQESKISGQSVSRKKFTP